MSSMTRFALYLPALFVLVFIAAGCGTRPGQDAAADQTPGFDAEAIDTSIDPCDDFYQYACGNWIAKNPIPADRGVYTRFSELAERNLSILRGILEEVSKPGAAGDSQERWIGDFYAACMDEEGIEEKGSAPLDDDLARIDAMTSVDDLAGILAHLHASGVSVSPASPRTPT
ncbi:MAG: M13 family metallopeptidase N-terminal domain-containing protein, partial [Gemmatimonadota bacterium]